MTGRPGGRCRTWPRCRGTWGTGFSGQPQRNGDAVDRVAEGKRGLRLHVGAAASPLRLVAPAAEHATEQVAKTPAGPRRTEQVAEIEAEPAAARRAAWRADAETIRTEQCSSLVVLLARFSSDRTSYASEISLKLSSDLFSPLLASGWYLRASFRYDCLISSALAVFCTPRTL